MSKASKNRISAWIWAVVIAGGFLLLSDWFKPPNANPNRTTILVKAPDTMVTAFENTFEELGLNKDYAIEVTDDVTKANFVVREGMNKEGKLIAYSPIIAIHNADTEYKKSLREKKILITSEVDSEYEDFDFYKVIQEALSGKGCEFKVYYPSKDSDSWEEFYHFMLFTVNDGYYPGTAEEMEKANQITNEFLNSKYAEPYNNNTIERSNGIAKNSIYFMAWADLWRLYVQSGGGFNCTAMYPKTVVYHSYYATYDELGKVVYDTFETDLDRFLEVTYNVGYWYLRLAGYNTKFSQYAANIGKMELRYEFNGVEIPGAEINIHDEEANNHE